MYKVHAEIEGVAPILFNRFGDEAKDNLETGKTGGKFTREQRLAEAMSKVYQDTRGLCLPSSNLKACLLEGVKRGKLKDGKSSALPYIAATVFATEPRLHFGKSYADFKNDCQTNIARPGGVGFIDERVGRRPPKTGGACLIKRPGLTEGWRLSVDLTVTDDRRDEEQIRRALEEAGLLCGLGDGRPEFGRFVVKTFGRVA